MTQPKRPTSLEQFQEKVRKLKPGQQTTWENIRPGVNLQELKNWFVSWLKYLAPLGGYPVEVDETPEVRSLTISRTKS